MTNIIDITTEDPRWDKAFDNFEMLCRHTVECCASYISTFPHDAEISIVLCDDEKIQKLNAEWREKDKATNVLSFPQDDPHHLGDIILSFDTIRRESDTDDKIFAHHVRHLLVHGLLHLLGYDHETSAEAEEMENLERLILAKMDIPDPYEQ